MDNYYTIKFGDLNEKIKNVREKKEQPKVEEKKKEVKQTEVEKPKEEKKNTETETVKKVEKNETVIEDTSKVTEKKIKRIRTLKSTN